jgi:NADPH-dependent ferric siderophore reductase
MSIIANSTAVVHDPRPGWVLDAQEAARLAWLQYGEAVESCRAGRVSTETAQAALAQAQAQQAYADDMLQYWIAGYEPVSVALAVEIDITVHHPLASW